MEDINLRIACFVVFAIWIFWELYKIDYIEQNYVKKKEMIE